MTIAHELVGAGPDGVLGCPGWFGDHTIFRPLYPYLDKAAFTYAFLDYRGYGENAGLGGEHSMREIAADAIAIADSHGWDRFHVVGHSMGGMAVQRIMVDAPGRVKSAVALTPVPASGVPFDADGWAWFQGAADSDANRRGIIDFTTGQRLPAAWLDAAVAASRATTTRDAFADYLVAWAKTDFVAEARGNPTPIKVIVGEHDPALNAETMRQTFLEWYPNAELEIMANAGHYPMSETPLALIASVEGFLKRHLA